MNVSIKLSLLDNVTGPIRRVSQAVASATRSIEGVRARSEAAFKNAANIRESAEGVSRFAEKARGAVESVVSAWQPLQAQLNRVRVMTKASSDEFTKMTELARTLGAEGHFSATEVAKGFEDLQRQGLNASQILDAMPRIYQAARVNNESLSEAIDQTTGLLDSFALGAEHMKSALDVTQAAAMAAGTPVNQMREAMAVAGVAANQYGISLKRTAVLAGLLATRNIEGSQAGTTLEKMLKVLKHPTKDAAGFFKDMGVSLTETINGVKTLRDPLTVLTQLQQSMTKHGVSAADQLTNMTILFERAAPDIMAMMEAAKTPGLQDLTKAVAGSTDAVANLATEIEGRGDKSLKRLKGTIDVLLGTMGEQLEPVTSRIVDALSSAAEAATKWMNENPGLTRALGIMAIATAGAATALAGLLFVLSTIVAGQAVSLFAAAFGIKLPLALLRGMIPAITSTVAAIPSLVAGMWAAIAPALAAAAPFLAVAAAIGAVSLAIVELAKHWEELDMFEVLKGINETFGESGALGVLAQTFNPRALLTDLGVGGGGNAPTIGGAGGSAASAAQGLIKIQVDSEGRATIREMQSTGVELEASAGVVMGQ